VTVDQIEDGTPGRPLAASIDVTEGAVRAVQHADEPMTGYKAIARLSVHLAAMWRAVYPHADGRSGTDGQLRADCLSRAREVEWALRLFQGQLSGEATTMNWSAEATLALLAQRLDGYRSAERALVTGLEAQLAEERREELASKYRRALSRAPTRPHPRSPRSGPIGWAGFWLHARWDRFLDTVDCRPGVGRDFPVPTPRGPGVPAQP
jgi:hypothetical protein